MDRARLSESTCVRDLYTNQNTVQSNYFKNDSGSFQLPMTIRITMEVTERLLENGVGRGELLFEGAVEGGGVLLQTPPIPQIERYKLDKNI